MWNTELFINLDETFSIIRVHIECINYKLNHCLIL